MVSVADAAISRSLSRGAPFSIKAPRTEPGLVAAVTLYGIPQMAMDWRKLTKPHGVRLAISAVFTHKAPQVSFKSAVAGGSPCELADLLVVVDDLNGRRAALVQAKMAAGKGTVQISGTKNKAQLDLFTRWPTFDFEEPIYGLKGLNLRRGGGGPTSGMYGIIDRHWSNPPRVPSWKQMVPTSVPGSVGKASSLGRFIVRMIYGTAGRDAAPASPPRETG